MRHASAATIALALALACGASGHAATLRDNLYGVRALGPSEAWAVGNFGAVQHTTDAGKTWQAVASGTQEPLFGVDFADAQHGWAVGKSALVIHSEDAGKTWKTQSTPLSVEKHLFKVKAIDARTAWAVGDWGAIISTRDGGATWDDRSLGVTPVKVEEVAGRRSTTITDDIILYDVSFPDPQHGFICGEFGTLLVTTDGGATWMRRTAPTEKTLFRVTTTRARLGGRHRGLVRTGRWRTWEVQHGHQSQRRGGHQLR